MKSKIVLTAAVLVGMLLASCGGVKPALQGKVRGPKPKCPAYSKIINKNADRRV